MEVMFVAPSDYECIVECFMNYQRACPTALPEGVSYCITEGLLIIIPLSLQSYQAGSGG